MPGSRTSATWTLLVLALARLPGCALAAVSFTNTEYYVKAGQPFTITWANNVGPVTITLMEGPDSNLQPVLVIASTYSGHSFTWTPPLTLKTGSYELQIQDSGSTDYSSRFTYLANPGDIVSNLPPTPTSPSAGTIASGATTSLSTPAIAAIASLSSVLLIALLLAAAYCLVHRRRKRRDKANNNDNDNDNNKGKLPDTAAQKQEGGGGGDLGWDLAGAPGSSNNNNGRHDVNDDDDGVLPWVMKTSAGVSSATPPSSTTWPVEAQEMDSERQRVELEARGLPWFAAGGAGVGGAWEKVRRGSSSRSGTPRKGDGKGHGEHGMGLAELSSEGKSLQ